MSKRCLFVTVLLSAAPAMGADVYWTGPAIGNWLDAANWSTNAAPAAADHVLIDGGRAQQSNVSLSAAATIARLSADAGDQLTINDGGTLTLSGAPLVQNGGIIDITSSASALSMQMIGAATIGGGGEIRLNGAWLAATTALHHGNHTIAGTGRVIANSLVNAAGGLIEARGNGTLALPIFGASVTNAGVFRASAGATLELSAAGATLQNHSGSIEAIDGGRVLVGSNAQISGGTFSTTNGGLILFETAAEPQYAPTLDGIINTGTITRGSTFGTVQLRGAMTNHGSIRTPPTAMIGTGTVTFNGSGVLLPDAIVGSGTLINGSGHTIRNAVSIGDTSDLGSTGAVVNHGTIENVVDDFTQIAIRADKSLVNTGLIRAGGGASVHMSSIGSGSAVLNSTGGILRAEDASRLVIRNMQVTGGRLETSGSGSILLTDNTSLTNVTIAGTVTNSLGTEIPLAGTINFDEGTLSFLGNNVQFTTGIRNTGNTAWTGDGTINLVGPFAQVVGSGRITSSITLRGAGRVQVPLDLTASGVVDADVAGKTISFSGNNSGLGRARAGSTLFVAGALTGGTLEAEAGGTISVISGSSLGGSGLVRIFATGSFNATQGSTNGSITLRNDGSARFNSVSSLRQLVGTGQIDVSRRVTAERFEQRTFVLRTSGALRHADLAGAPTASRVEAIEFLGGAFDVTDNGLIIDYPQGASALAQISSAIFSGFAGGSWNGSGIISSTAAGRSDVAIGYSEAAELGLTSFLGTAVDNTAVVVRYTLTGDTNLDGLVNIGDFAVLAASFNMPSAWTSGDFNYSTITDIADFSLLASNFNRALPGDVPRSSIPEPFGACVFTLIVASMRRRR